jgi:hypothetical protein
MRREEYLGNTEQILTTLISHAQPQEIRDGIA